MDPRNIKPMYPFKINYGEGDMQYFGMQTKEYIATQILTALIAKNHGSTFKHLIGTAVELADILIDTIQTQQNDVEKN